MRNDTENSMDLVWGANNIAALIGRSERSTYAMLEAGQLPAKQVGKRWVASRAKMLAFFLGEEAA